MAARPVTNFSRVRRARGDIDRRNRATWSEVATEYAALEGWTDAGERAALARVAPSVRGTPVLDVGAGAGRTAAFLRLLSDDYVAVDYTPEMVEAFRRNHPDLEIHEADARNLARFDDATFGLAVFSYNGIDDIPHGDRLKVLSELRRVVRPGGWVLYSTHNLAGPGFGEVPWRTRSSRSLPSRLVRWLVTLPRDGARRVQCWRNWWAIRALAEQGEGWAVRPSRAHDFTILMHYTSAAAVRAEAVDAGFDEVTLLDDRRGAAVEPGDALTQVVWFQVLARVPAR